MLTHAEVCGRMLTPLLSVSSEDALPSPISSHSYVATFCITCARIFFIYFTTCQRVGFVELSSAVQLTACQRYDVPVAPSAYVSIRRHTSAYVSIRQNTSAYVCGNGAIFFTRGREVVVVLVCRCWRSLS